MQGHGYCHPLRVPIGGSSLGAAAGWTWNTPTALLDVLAHLWNLEHRLDEARAAIGTPQPTGAQEEIRREMAAHLLFWHSVSMLHANAYRTEHLRSLRYLWPRLPIATDLDAVLPSARLGRLIGELYREPSIQLPAVPTAFQEELQQKYVNGRVRREGPSSVEVGRDGSAPVVVRWRPVPEPVWKKVIGGRQTLRDLLERWRNREPFTSQTAHEYTGIIRRVAMLVKAGTAASDCYLQAQQSAASRAQLGLQEVSFDGEEDEGQEDEGQEEEEEMAV